MEYIILIVSLPGSSKRKLVKEHIPEKTKLSLDNMTVYPLVLFKMFF